MQVTLVSPRFPPVMCRPIRAGITHGRGRPHDDDIEITGRGPDDFR